jgi:hypothetical protein
MRAVTCILERDPVRSRYSSGDRDVVDAIRCGRLGQSVCVDLVPDLTWKTQERRFGVLKLTETPMSVGASADPRLRGTYVAAQASRVFVMSVMVAESKQLLVLNFGVRVVHVCGWRGLESRGWIKYGRCWHVRPRAFAGVVIQDTLIDSDTVSHL